MRKIFLALTALAVVAVLLLPAFSAKAGITEGPDGFPLPSVMGGECATELCP
jgi:hypothetical protein